MKTGAWLRGGRGKIAGMVAQKSSDGKGTVLRELVIPKNPQSIDQMATRLAFGTVTQAAALMLPIIGQTFKGQPDEKMNRRRFVSLNVPLLKAEAISQNAGNAPQSAFRGKSSSALIPTGYIMSEGSLVTPEALNPQVSLQNPANPTIILPRYASPKLVVGQEYSPAKLISEIIGLGVNQQLTCVAIATLHSDSVLNYGPMETTGDFVRESGFAACRINLNPDAPKFTFTAETTEQQIKEFLTTGFDEEKTTAVYLAEFIAAIELTNEGEIFIDSSLVDDLANIIVGGEYDIIAFGCILSQLIDGRWDYNNSKLACKPIVGNVEPSNWNYYGLTFGNALIDYLGSQAASKLFTRKGGLINEF